MACSRIAAGSAGSVIGGNIGFRRRKRRATCRCTGTTPRGATAGADAERPFALGAALPQQCARRGNGITCSRITHGSCVRQRSSPAATRHWGNHTLVGGCAGPAGLVHANLLPRSGPLTRAQYHRCTQRLTDCHHAVDSATQEAAALPLVASWRNNDHNKAAGAPSAPNGLCQRPLGAGRRYCAEPVPGRADACGAGTVCSANFACWWTLTPRTGPESPPRARQT